MVRIASNGAAIYYQEDGAGFPLILLHGLSDSSRLWAPLIPELSGFYRVVAPDIRGHGESEKSNTPYSIQVFTEDLVHLLQDIGIANAHVVGFSLGAAIAQQLALDHPEKIRSLTLLSPFSYCGLTLRGNLERLRESLIKGGLPAFFDEAIKLVVAPDFVSSNSDLIAEMKKECVKVNSPAAILRSIDACMNFNVKDRLSAISLPALIISGREDVMSSISLAQQIHLSIKNSDWKTLEGVGHNLLVPNKVPELGKIIAEFVGHH
jgi:3-oxoadipate enol-lactonase